MTRRIVIVGGGIVGSALAAYLSEADGLAVTVLERGPRQRFVGSTGLAPGLVGLLNEASVATDLARASAAAYAQLQHAGRVGFDQAGCLEVATTPAGMHALEDRAALAREADLPAHVLDRARAVAAAPGLVGASTCVGGVLYPSDGTARPDVITSAFRDRAAGAGVRFVYDTEVSAIDTRADHVTAVRAGITYPADDVVVACGIWGPAVLALAGQSLPITAVAHPYVYAPAHGGAQASAPFVRWPERHVYARDHGDRLGLGTYDHHPLPVAPDDLGLDAEQVWAAGSFDAAVTQALALLPEERRFVPERRLNGVFSMTPDNLPLVGPVESLAGLWAAEALWVTHAAGAAHALATQMTSAPAQIHGMDALRPDRFYGQPAAILTARALALYRDIYATT